MRWLVCMALCLPLGLALGLSVLVWERTRPPAAQGWGGCPAGFVASGLDRAGRPLACPPAPW